MKPRIVLATALLVVASGALALGVAEVALRVSGLASPLMVAPGMCTIPGSPPEKPSRVANTSGSIIAPPADSGSELLVSATRRPVGIAGSGAV